MNNLINKIVLTYQNVVFGSITIDLWGIFTIKYCDPKLKFVQQDTSYL